MDYIIKEPLGDDHKKGHRFPFIASELLSCEVPKIMEYFFTYDKEKVIEETLEVVKKVKNELKETSNLNKEEKFDEIDNKLGDNKEPKNDNAKNNLKDSHDKVKVKPKNSNEVLQFNFDFGDKIKESKV